MKKEYTFTPADTMLAIGLLLLGLLFWEFSVINVPHSAIGTFIFIIYAVSLVSIYFIKKRIKQNIKSIIVLCIIILGALPFLLYDPTYIFIVLLGFEFLACLLWVMLVCKNQVDFKLSGFVFVDSINQTITTPLCNYDGIFRSLLSRRRDRKGGKTLLFAFAGIVIAFPLLLIVINLLSSADDGFARIAEKIFEFISIKQILIYILELLIGIPIAAYFFGAVYGNAHQRFAQVLTKESSTSLLEKLHAIPRPALYAPLIVLNLIYVLFFVAMGAYLFSGFTGELPAEYTYSAYARKGFFELCAVASINLIVLAIVYIFGKRKDKEHPTWMRLLTCLFSALTVLLILTAISKMLLYIGSYGLTQMRVYVMVFLVFIMIIFLVLIIWHIRPFNAGKPIITVGVILLLALFLSNHQGLIATYNIENYKNGNLRELDVKVFENMSDAVVPPLVDLRDSLQENDPLREQIQETIASHIWDYVEDDFWGGSIDDAFSSWNIQSHLLEKGMQSTQNK